MTKTRNNRTIARLLGTSIHALQIAVIFIVLGMIAPTRAALFQSEIVVSVRDFAAVGDGVTDDATAIQRAIIFAFANSRNLYFPSATYAVGTTIIIPQYMNYTMRGININGGNSNFKMLNDTTLFTSGYYNGGSLVTNFSTSDDSHYSAGITPRITEGLTKQLRLERERCKSRV